ncbi:MAG: diphthamide biosynthesis enzyme Dph2 [Thermoplasmata archaeon]|nr:diphthamide biosynthesis enzyme Dph2 [Thermoplasmata archaeon]
MISDWEIQRILDEIERRGSRTVVLQLPEGLKKDAARVAGKLEERGNVTVVVSADPCYGACDLTAFRGDLLVHFGHAPISVPDEDVLFIELSSDLDLLPLLEEVLPKLKKSVAITAAIQYVPSLPTVKGFLEQNGLEVHVGEGDSRVAYPGQILGCNFSAPRAVSENVEQFLYVGEGNFHPLGISLATGKDVLVVDPEMNEIRDMAEFRDRILRQRHAIITDLDSASSFGIVVSSKSGQNRFGLARKMKEDLEKNGKKAVLFLLDNLNPDNLLGLDVDAFVSVACPRIAIDDYALHKKPIITPLELEIVLGERKWEDYAFDEIEGDR